MVTLRLQRGSLKELKPEINQEKKQYVMAVTLCEKNNAGYLKIACIKKIILKIKNVEYK